MIRQPKVTEFGQVGRIYIESLKSIDHPDLDDNTEELFLFYLYKFAQTPRCNILVSLDEADETVVTGFIMGSIELAGCSTTAKGFCENLHVLKKYSHQHSGPKLITELSKWFKTFDGVKVHEFMCLASDKNIDRWEKLGYKKHSIVFRKEK